MVGLAGALQSLKLAGDVVKTLRDADSGLRGAELKMKIAELAEALADARLAVLDAQEEIQSLTDRIAELEKSEAVESELIRRDNVLFRKTETGEAGPYCVQCFEESGALRTVTRLPAVFRDVGKYKCPKCEAIY